MCFRDRNYDALNKGEILGAIGDDSLLPTLLRKENQKIYNLEEWVTITNSKTKRMYEEKIIGKEIFVPVDKDTLERKKDYLSKNHFEILEETELKGKYCFLRPSDTLYLLKVVKK